MSEYWKSNAKFYCRFCNIYITDNKSTRNIHDSGSKHKENVERFLRDQSQRGRQKEADTARMNKQMDAIEKAALKQYKLDVEAGLVQPSVEMTAALEAAEAAEAAATSAPPQKSGAGSSSIKPSSPQPSSKGTGSNSEPVAFNPVKTETASTPVKTEAASKHLKDETIGQPGAWETVEAPAPMASSPTSSSKRDLDGKIKNEDGTESHIVPGADDDDEGVADPEDLKGFKIVEKTYPVDGDDDELDGAAAEGSGGSLFKKRKTGGKAKNTRRKL